MKKAKILSLILAATIVSTNIAVKPVFAAGGVDFNLSNVDTSKSASAIKGTYSVTNNGNETIKLSDVKIRYYFTSDSKNALQFNCYNADIKEGEYRSLTGNVTGKFVKMDEKAGNADTYLEIGFDSQAGNLEAGKTVNIDSSFNNTSWSSFNQVNDYSFNDADKVVVLVDGKVVSGTEPTPVKDDSSESTPAQVSVDLTLENGENANSLAPTFIIKNTGDEEVDLTTMKLKYFYTADGSEAETFNCYYAGTIDGEYINYTDSIDGKIAKLSTEVSNADSYIQIGFKDGTLAVGQSAKVQTSVNKDGWKDYNQSDDYSYGNSKHVAVYSNDKLIWGSEPDRTPVIVSSKLNKTSISVDKAKINDETVKITLNGNKFTGISGLTEGTDYTVTNGDTVVIKSEYLHTLTVGTSSLVFNFNAGDSQKLNVNVTDTTVENPVEKDAVITPVSVDYNKQDKADVDVTMTLNGNTLTSIKNNDVVLKAGTDYVQDGENVTLKQSYLDTLKEGEITKLNFVFSNGKIQTLKVNVIANTAVEDGLTISLPDVSTTGAGATITIPVTITGIDPDKDLNGCNFRLKYDTNVFDDVSVTPGDILVNPNKTFFKVLNKDTGIISIMYADSTGQELEAIQKDGLFMNINLKVRDDVTNTASKIEVAKEGTFVDINLEKYKINYKIGTITIGDGEVEVPVVTDSKLTKSVEEYNTKDKNTVEVGMILNGNELAEIKNGDKVLSKDSDYTVSGTDVNFTNDYLETLKEGSNVLTFVFNKGENAEFNVNVIKEDENTIVAGIGKLEASAGDTMTLPVTLSKAPSQGIANFGYRIKYDYKLIDVLGVEAGDAITNPEQNFINDVYVNKNDDGIVSVLFIDSSLTEEELIKTGGILTNIKLKVKDDVKAGTIPIEFNDDDHSFYDMDGNEIQVRFDAGSINVK